jgi:hypothetical protein
MTKKRHTIEVTQTDIETAVPKDSGHCAIADAIARQIPGASRVTVDLQTIRWTDTEKGERYVYLTPRVAQALLLDFDQGERDYCQPLSFRLDRPVHIVPVMANKGPAIAQARAEAAARLDSLRARQNAGEDLSRDEKAVITRADARAARAPSAPRPKSRGPRTVAPVGPDSAGDPSGALTVEGGRPAPIGALAHGPGKTRRFGVKAAGSPLGAVKP